MYQQAQGQKAMHGYQAQVAANNAKVAEWQAQDAQRRGEQEAREARRRGAQIAGRQRSTMAARGLDLAYGNPADILDDTAYFSMVDQQTARANAAKEAWGHRTQKGYLLGEAAAQRQAGRNVRPGMQAGLTLLGGAAQVADRWYSYS